MMSPQEIKEKRLYVEMGMTEKEFESVTDILGRLPNFTELGLFSVMWSEHCSYKNSKVLLRKFPTSGESVLQGPGEGAGIVDIGDGRAVAFKIESHNRPSAVEPYNGAATGVGGIVRDVFSMGARPVAILGSFRFGELSNERTKYLLKEVVRGSAEYARAIGVPTVGGEIQFDECYETNPLVNVMCVGLLKHEDVRRGLAKGEGNSVIYAGAATGKDGVHGATFASTELAQNAEEKKPLVPAGNPHLEKALMEACLEAMRHPALIGIQDMGAAGLTSSSSEMASKGGMGIELDLDKVPVCEDDISAYEIMLSESQERMLLVAEKGKEQEIIDIFKKHGVTALVVGKVTDEPYLRLYYKNELCAEVMADALATAAPEYRKPSRQAAYYEESNCKDAGIMEITDYNQTLIDLLSTPTIASKKSLYEMADYEAGGHTLVPPGMTAGIVRVPGTDKALAMSVDCNARYVYLDPKIGGKIAVAEAARNVTAAGATPLAITDNLNFGSPENPEIYWQMEQAVEGISEACIALGTPVISGNVSLYNERGSSAIYPTPTIGIVGLIEDINHITTSDFKQVGDLIYLLGETRSEFGGSELQKLQYGGKIFGEPPSIDLEEEKRNQQMLRSAIRAGFVCAAHDISEGGLAVALAECLMLSIKTNVTDSVCLGANIELNVECPTSFLFAESQSRYVVCVRPEYRESFETMTGAVLLGSVTETGRLEICLNGIIQISAEAAAMKKSWEGAIECLLK